ncbi:MAG: hypothetical protein Ct9H300mP16_13260 [Pseudomonadota bacterium]|nr:MAG: hypothetical protein Ct9H300mP16_13260 [Pseudomonadota bacterium]
MADKKIRQTEFLLQVFQQVDHLCLNGYIERGDGFIQMMNSGFKARALAIPIRWRCPPENSWG